MRFLPKLFVVALLALAVATTSAAAKQNARAAAEAAGKTFSDAVKAGDTAKIAALYAEDAKAFPPNGELTTGRAAIQKLWQDVLASGVKEIQIKPTEVEESGNLAYEVGTYVINGEGGKHLDHGKYVVVWKKQKGQWMMYRDIWNSDMPAAAPAH